MDRNILYVVMNHILYGYDILTLCCILNMTQYDITLSPSHSQHVKILQGRWVTLTCRKIAFNIKLRNGHELFFFPLTINTLVTNTYLQVDRGTNNLYD